MPAYKWPSWRLVLHRMFDRGWAFIYRAGTIILASMILVWALLYFPATDRSGRSYEERLCALEDSASALSARLEELPAAAAHQGERAELSRQVEALDDQRKELLAEWRTNSYLGRLGQWCEPAVRPLGWDWRIGMAALASFPAREVVVGTLGIIYHEGEIDTGSAEARLSLAERLKVARWDAGSARAGQPVFNPAVALSLMVFFVFCCQCASTLAVMKRETNSWRWPLFAFVYMTGLAYVAALATYQIGRLTL
jgi:ferrous iron transport protein B